MEIGEGKSAGEKAVGDERKLIWCNLKGDSLCKKRDRQRHRRGLWGNEGGILNGENVMTTRKHFSFLVTAAPNCHKIKPL